MWTFQWLYNCCVKRSSHSPSPTGCAFPNPIGAGRPNSRCTSLPHPLVLFPNKFAFHACKQLPLNKGSYSLSPSPSSKPCRDAFKATSLTRLQPCSDHSPPHTLTLFRCHSVFPFSFGPSCCLLSRCVNTCRQSHPALVLHCTEILVCKYSWGTAQFVDKKQRVGSVTRGITSRHVRFSTFKTH